MRISSAVEILASPEQVWPYLEEPGRMELWWPGLESFTLADHPAGPGTRFELVITEGAARARYQGRILERDPPRRLVRTLCGGSLPPEAAIVTEYELMDLIGRTRITCETLIDFDGRLFRVLSPLVMAVSKLQIRRQMKMLKRLVESEAAA